MAADPATTRVLVVSLAPYRFATRARKAARTLAAVADVVYLAPSGVGRTSHWDVPRRTRIDGVRVIQVPVAAARNEPTRANQAVNLVRSYLPALGRLVREALRTPADVVFVNDPPLALVGWLHRRRFGSALVVDVHERPGMVTAGGSLFAAFSRSELGLLRRIAPITALATVATYSDLDVVRGLGFSRVTQLRNAPLRDWRAAYRPPPPRQDRPFRLVLIGSVFEGRGYELLLEAMALATAEVDATLDVFGPGRESYLRSLQELAERLGLGERVRWRGRLATDEVSAAYLDADAGLVLYEPSDPGNDGLSNKILECVASGRPVIATDLPENRRFVEANGCGWLTGMAPAQIAATIAAAARSPDLDEIGDRCRRLAEGGLAWETDFAPVTELVTGARDAQRSQP